MASLRGALLLTTLLLNNAVQADDRVCYYPNGVESGDVPCSSSDQTHCCGPYGICLENGFCINTSGKPYTLSRGSCTDPDWGGSCPTQCTDSPYDGIGATIGIFHEVMGSWSSYCCGTPEVDDGGELACPNNLTSFTIEHGDMIYGYAGLANATEISGTSPSSTTSATPSPVGDSTGATSSPGSSDGSSSGGGGGSSTGSSNTAVGAGVGVSLGVSLAGALAWGFWERRKRLQERRAAGGMPVAVPSEPKPSYAGYPSAPRTPYPPQPPQAYSPQPYYPPQPAYAPQAAQVPPQVPGELPHHSLDAVEMMDNPRQY